MGPYILPRWSWLNIRTMANHKIGRWVRDFHTVRRGINPDNVRVRPRVVGVVDVWIDSDPGMWPYRARVTPTLCTYESWPMRDQTKTTCFYFRL